MTNKDGSQSVQTIKNELGMKPKDMADIKARLQEQGIDGDYNVDLYGQADNRDKARNPNAKPVNTSVYIPLFIYLHSVWYSITYGGAGGWQQSKWCAAGLGSTERAATANTIVRRFDHHDCQLSISLSVCFVLRYLHSPGITDFQSEFMILKRLLYNPPVDLESFWCVNW